MCRPLKYKHSLHAITLSLSVLRAVLSSIMGHIGQLFALFNWKWHHSVGVVVTFPCARQLKRQHIFQPPMSGDILCALCALMALYPTYARISTAFSLYLSWHSHIHRKHTTTAPLLFRFTFWSAPWVRKCLGMMQLRTHTRGSMLKASFHPWWANSHSVYMYVHNNTV